MNGDPRELFVLSPRERGEDERRGAASPDDHGIERREWRGLPDACPSPLILPVRREKRRQPSGMKGVHPNKNRQFGSQVPCVTSRDVRQKRDRKAAGCTLCGCEVTGRNVSEPMSSLVKRNGEAEPLGRWRNTLAQGSVRQHGPIRVGRCVGLLARGSRDGTPRREDAEHGRPRSERVATATEAQDASQGQGAGRGVGRVHCTREGGESRWREGALLDDASSAGKERGLWEH
jgi:hypothetical protein